MTTTTLRKVGMTAVLVSAAQPDVPSPAPRRAHLLAGAPARDLPLDDIVHQWGLQSFPASDPPANW
jgi:hypothetical protein